MRSLTFSVEGRKPVVYSSLDSMFHMSILPVIKGTYVLNVMELVLWGVLRSHTCRVPKKKGPEYSYLNDQRFKAWTKAILHPCEKKYCLVPAGQACLARDSSGFVMWPHDGRGGWGSYHEIRRKADILKGN